MIAKPWKIGNDKGIGFCSDNSGGVMRHVIDGNFQCVIVSEDDHAETIANEDDVCSGFCNHFGAWGVIGGEHDKRSVSISDFMR